MTDHPVTPPPELVHEWDASWRKTKHAHENYSDYIATQAAQWGADQELEACCSEMNDWGDIHNSAGWELSQDLRAARRPKPPSLAEEALKALDHLCVNHPKATDQEKTILRAIKRLQELEGND